MGNKNKQHRRNDFPTEDFQSWTKEYLVENKYATEDMIPDNVSELNNDSGYISVMPPIPTKTSQLTNDSGFINSAPVSSVNGQTGAVSLVLFSGAYSALTGKPTLFSGAYTDLTGKPTLFSGSYLDLTNKPTIPAAQVQSDWNATSGVSLILNKPTIPTVRRVETFSGVTDSSGNFTVTYSTAYPAAPHVNPQIIAGTPSQVVRVTASSTTGFTVNATNRATVTLLATEVLLAATTPVVGASISVSVLARA